MNIILPCSFYYYLYNLKCIQALAITIQRDKHKTIKNEQRFPKCVIFLVKLISRKNCEKKLSKKNLQSLRTGGTLVFLNSCPLFLNGKRGPVFVNHYFRSETISCIHNILLQEKW